MTVKKPISILVSSTDLSGLADSKWYSRSFSLGNFSGKTVSYVSIGVEGDKSGEYRAYFKSIRITDNTFTKWYFNNAASLSAIQQMQNYGYSSTVVKVVPCYNPIDDRIGPPIRLDACKISARTYVAWTSVLSNKSKSGVGYSLDHGNSWIACHNNAPLPYFPAGLSVSGQSIMFRQLLASGDTPEDAASIKQFEFTCLPGYNGTKTDLFKYVVNGSDWAAGTFTNTNTSFDPHTLKLSGATTRFDTIPSTTNFGSSGSSPYINNKTLALQVNGIGDLRVRCDFAGKYQNFLAEVDIQVSAHYSIGLVYRGTNWGMSLDSYAYSVTVGLTSILLARGSNSTGAGNFTSVQNVTGLALPEGSWHRLKLIVNGTSHKAYLNEVLMINSTDSTYNFAGHVGLRVYNPTASTTFTGYVNNFGVVPSLSGTWLSPTLDLTPLGTYESSVLYYGDVSGDLAGNPSDCTVLFEYTKDFGSTWTDVPLGGGLSLTPGASTIGMTLQFRFTLSTTSATTLAGVNAVVLKILGGFSSRGYRIGPVLQLESVGRAGNTLVYWSGVQAAGTSIALDTSIDGGGIWSQIGTGAQGAAQIAGITTQADPTIDDFGTDTSHSYTSTSLSTGDPATWITANNSLIASGGKNALYIYNTPSIGADGDVQVIMDQATASGLVWRYAGNNYYEMVVHDASSSNNPNTIQLFKAVSGTTIQIGSTISISFTRGTPHIFRVNMVGSAITIYMDGNSLLSITDTTISVAGYCGLSNSGSSARYYMLRIQTYGDDLTGKQVYTRVRLESTSPIVTPQLQNLSISVHNANIQNGVLIPGPTNYSVLNGHKKTIAQIFDDLCKQSGNYWWRIVAGQLYFQSYQAIPAPFVITNKDVLVANAKVMNGNAVYRNAQWMTGVKDRVRLPPQRFLGNGVNQTFTLPFPVSSINSITVNGVESRVGVKNADVGKDWYYKQGDPQIVQDAAALPLNDTQMLSIECEVEVDITIHVKRDAEIANRAAIDRSSGIIEEVEAAPSGATKACMIVKADGLLTQCAVAGKTATFTTRRNGLAVGQLVSMFVSPFGIFDGVFLITDVGITWQTESHNGVKVLQPTFSIVAVQGPIIGDWTRFIDNLAGG